MLGALLTFGGGHAAEEDPGELLAAVVVALLLQLAEAGAAQPGGRWQMKDDENIVTRTKCFQTDDTYYIISLGERCSKGGK